MASTSSKKGGGLLKGISRVVGRKSSKSKEGKMPLLAPPDDVLARVAALPSKETAIDWDGGPGATTPVTLDESADMTDPDSDGDFVRAYCSGCRERTHHERTQRNMLLADEYRCTACSAATALCPNHGEPCLPTGQPPTSRAVRGCRGLRHISQDRCFWCGGNAVSDRNTELIARWCSWCWKHTTHTEQKVGGIWERSVYRCGSSRCGLGTVRCTSCDEAMARSWDGRLPDDRRCARCCSVVSEWGDIGAKDKHMSAAWCPGCHEFAAAVLFFNHQYMCSWWSMFTASNIDTESVYVCMQCSTLWMPCNKCTKGGWAVDAEQVLDGAKLTRGTDDHPFCEGCVAQSMGRDEPTVMRSDCTFKWPELPHLQRPPTKQISTKACTALCDDKPRAKCVDPVDQWNVITTPCSDGESRLVVVLAMARLPDNCSAAHLEAFRAHVLSVLNEASAHEYVCIFSASEEESPFDLSWLRNTYNELPRSARKNLKKLYVIQPSAAVRAVSSFASLFVSSKVWKKVVFVNLCSDFDEYLQQNINALDLPSQTLRAIAYNGS